MAITVTVEGQELQLLDENQLSLVYDKTKKVDTWILDKFFPNKVAFDNQDHLPLDKLETSQPLAPFVSPVVAGKVIKEEGKFERKYLPFPYVKPAKMVTPTNSYDLALFGQLKEAGIIKSNVAKRDKYLLAQITANNELRASITNRKTLMAMDVLTKGKTTAVSDDHEAVEIDFGRHSDLNFVPAVKWSDPKAKIATDIDTMNLLLIEHGGTGAKAIVSSSKVFATAVKNAEFKERFVEPKGSTAPNPFNLGLSQLKAKLVGHVDNRIEWWTYDETHKLNGKVERFISEEGFYMIADNAGYQAQGEIKHMRADGVAHEFYLDLIEQKDPSGIKMVCESSPIIAPSNINGVCGGDEFL